MEVEVEEEKEEEEEWNPLGAIIGFTASVGLVLPLSPSIWSIHSMEIG